MGYKNKIESLSAGYRSEIARLRKRAGDKNSRKPTGARCKEWPFVVELDGVERPTSEFEREMYTEGYTDGRHHGQISLKWPLLLLTGSAITIGLLVCPPGDFGQSAGHLKSDDRRAENTSGARQRYTGSWRSIMWKKEPLDD